MAQYYDIDTDVRINGNLTVGAITGSGDISIPSNTISASSVNATNIIASGTISGNTLAGDGSEITNLSSSAMTDVLKLDGTRQMTGTLTINAGGMSTSISDNNVQFNRTNGTSYVDNLGSGGSIAFRVNGANTTALTFLNDGTSTFGGNITATSKVITSGTINATSNLQENGTNLSSKYALQATSISTGSGLTGGGTLASTRTLSVSFGGNGSSTTVSHSDHNHDTSYLSLNGGTVYTSFFGDSAYGYIRLTAGTSGSYIQATDKNQSGNTTLWLTGMNGSATTVRTPNNVLDDGSGNITISNTISEGGTLLSTKYASSSRNISTGSGLTGGGNLSADRTLSVNFGGNGTATTISRSDHNHDSTYLSLNGGNMTGALTTNGQLIINQYNAGIQFALGSFNNSVSGTQWWHGPNGSGDNVLSITKGGSGNSNYSFYINGTDKVWTSANDGSGSTLDADTVDQIQGSSLVRNDVSNQNVQGGFTVLGTSYFGPTNNSGAIVVRNPSGQNGIQLAGDNATQLANVGSYIASNGNANFTGTVSVNNLTITSTSKISNLNAEMVNGVKEPQITKNPSIYELGGKGVYTGLNVSAQSVPNMTVLINSGTVYTDSGMRVVIPNTSVALSSASTTYGRIDVVYVKGSTQGANEGTLAVLTGTPASSPIAPTVPSDGVELAQISVPVNIGSIQNNQITDMRVWRNANYNPATDFLNLNQTNLNIVGSIYGVVTFNNPIKNSGSNTSITFNAGTNTYTWTHNLNLSNYVVRFSCNSPEPHIYWTNKTSNAITINLDDTFLDTIIVDASIEAF